MSVILILFLIYTPPNLSDQRIPKASHGIILLRFRSPDLSSTFFSSLEFSWQLNVADIYAHLTHMDSPKLCIGAHSRPEIHRTVGNKIRMYKSSTTSSLLSFSICFGVPKKRGERSLPSRGTKTSGISDTFFLGKSGV